MDICAALIRPAGLVKNHAVLTMQLVAKNTLRANSIKPLQNLTTHALDLVESFWLRSFLLVEQAGSSEDLSLCHLFWLVVQKDVPHLE